MQMAHLPIPTTLEGLVAMIIVGSILTVAMLGVAFAVAGIFFYFLENKMKHPGFLESFCFNTSLLCGVIGVLFLINYFRIDPVELTMMIAKLLS